MAVAGFSSGGVAIRLVLLVFWTIYVTWVGRPAGNWVDLNFRWRRKVSGLVSLSYTRSGSWRERIVTCCITVRRIAFEKTCNTPMTFKVVRNDAIRRAYICTPELLIWSLISRRSYSGLPFQDASLDFRGHVAVDEVSPTVAPSPMPKRYLTSVDWIQTAVDLGRLSGASSNVGDFSGRKYERKQLSP